MRRILTFGSVGFASAVGALVVAAAAWACIPVATLTTSPVEARAGEEVLVTGTEYGTKSPVLIRFNALDGPVLATLSPDQDGIIRGNVAVPAGTRPGNYVLVATQDAVSGETTWGVPSRALVTVVGDGGAPVVSAPVEEIEAGRPAGLQRGESSVGAGALILAGVGVAGVAMFVAGMAALFVSRRKSVPEAARTTR